MTSHKTSMRTIGAVPTWDFTSLVNTAQLAITIGTQPIYSQQVQTATQPPLHLRHSALANPVHQPTTTTSFTSADTRLQTRQQTNRKRKEVADKVVHEEKKCQHHPNSKTHTTEECRMKGKVQRGNSPPKPKSTAITQAPAAAVTLPSPKPLTQPSFQQPRQTRQTAHKLSVATDLSTVQCFRCQGYGHYANQCPAT